MDTRTRNGAAPAAPAIPGKEPFQRLIDGLQTLMRAHLALARLELREDLQRVGRDLAGSAAGLPLAFVGYALLMVALSLLLAQWLPSWAAFGVIALVNLGPGLALSIAFGRRLRSPQLPGSSEEIRRDKRWMQSLRDTTEPPRPEARAGTLPTQTPLARPVVAAGRPHGD